MIKNTITLLIVLLSVIYLTACSTPKAPSVIVQEQPHRVSYLKEIKPILDRRCVTCHSCYNSPCQAKYSSYEGIDRGASKIKVYDATRLLAIAPTRLFIDANSTQQWREKGFYSLTENSETNSSKNNSIMLGLLHDKMEHPEIIGDYEPENDELICPRDRKELGEYLDKKANHGMPYGFPAIKKSEYATLAQWLQQGAHGPTEKEHLFMTTPSVKAQKEIEKWEAFFNADDAKHQMTARYLYEHLYLAHLSFDTSPLEFYRLIRSKTPFPKPVEEIGTLRPFDDPHVDRVYYRFVRIHSTIVHKTHMVFALNEQMMARFNELFINIPWDETPHVAPYDVHIAANPFLAFKQIPAQSRYQFLLDNSHYIIMTFIRGPVCRGQIALNVIHDHFWVMFKDPKHDLTITTPNFLVEQAENLSLPIESVEQQLVKAFSDAYREKYLQYAEAKRDLYATQLPEGNGYDSIWKGDKAEDAPLLTVYRHFDSASVHKGVLGAAPRTVWVIDYPQFERIYYTLVAGYDVFGNLSHQTNIRRYTDFLRMEGEQNFISYIPKEQRLKMFKSWYIGDSDVQDLDAIPAEGQDTKIAYKTEYPKDEFVTHVINEVIRPDVNISYDRLNYVSPTQTPPPTPKEYKCYEDYVTAARSITAPGSGFISYVRDRGANNILVRVMMKDGSSLIDTIVINRWHDNVNSMFSEEDTLDAKKDTLDIISGSVGSYPNVFVIVHIDEFPEFIDLMKNANGDEKYDKIFRKFFISRSDPKFWETYDWFQEQYFKRHPREAGLYDLNRYYRTPW